MRIRKQIYSKMIPLEKIKIVIDGNFSCSLKCKYLKKSRGTVLAEELKRENIVPIFECRLFNKGLTTRHCSIEYEISRCFDCVKWFGGTSIKKYEDYLYGQNE